MNSKDNWFPLDDEQHEAQLSFLRELPRPGPVLDLGCGDGRLLVPLSEAGFRVTGVDNDEEALAACRGRLPADTAAELHAGDFLTDELPGLKAGSYAAVLCLGNTFTLIHEPLSAVKLLKRIHDLLQPGGTFYIDAFCEDMWREVAEGYWQEGLSETGEAQLLWVPGDNVIALRYDEEVDIEADQVREKDRLYRLWTYGELRLLSELSGLAPPRVHHEGYLVGMSRFR